jgi:hypothetical protein
VLGLISWQVYSGRRSLVPGAVVLGLAAGFRQSSLLLLGPLFLLSCRKASRRQIFAGAAAFCATALCWFVPMVVESGGLSRYFAALYGMWSAVPAQRTVFSHSLLEGISLGLSRVVVMLFVATLCFGPFVFLPLLTRRVDSENKRGYVLAWLVPGLLFFTLIYLIFVNSGYLLILCPPIFAWLGSRMAQWMRASTDRWATGGVVTACTILNLVLFVWGPWYCSFRSVRALEADLALMQRSVREQFSPRETLLVSFDSHFLGFRHVGYYLPEFLTLAYPESQRGGRTAALGMVGGRTQVLAQPPGGRRTFVMLPLPPGQRYDRYQQSVIDLFPAQALRAVTDRGHLFRVGTLADLRYAFPVTLRSESPLYTGVDTNR